MKGYFATFITGFSDVIFDELRKFDKDIELIEMADGLVIFNTTKGIESLKNLRFLSNIFDLIDLRYSKDIDIQRYIKDLVDSGLDFSEAFIPKKNKYFRVSILDSSNLIRVDNLLLNSLEKKISSELKMTVDKGLPDSEFWVVSRDNLLYLFGHKITYHKDYKKTLSKGELRPDLCSLLCVLSEPSKDDMFLDPFAGSEAIVLERKKILGYEKLTSGDISFRDDKQLDALNLSSIKDATINKIVTDPPWGITLGKSLDLNLFYTKMLSEFYRVLTRGGILVVLIGNKELFDKILLNFVDKFETSNKYDVLINGRKARVYKLIKK